jgi:hypothetical protein
MAYYLSEILLWLFIINVGTAFGAGLYEAKIVIPQWTAVPAGGGFHWNAEAARRTDPDHKFWAFLTTVPLTFLTLASLVAAWYSVSPRRELWLGAAVVVLVERIATFAYFIPTMVKLQRETARSSTVETKASRWVSLNYVRNGVYLAAWVTALQALAYAR